MPDFRKARRTAGLSLACCHCEYGTSGCQPAENHSCRFALRGLREAEMGKFFLIIIAVSVALLLAMSAYVISL